MKILLACHGGFSRSILVRKMQEAAESEGLVIDINAIPVDDIQNHEKDIVLLGQQIAHELETLEDELSVPVFVIDSFDYGTMNGENVLKFVLDKLKGN